MKGWVVLVAEDPIAFLVEGVAKPLGRFEGIALRGPCGSDYPSLKSHARNTCPPGSVSKHKASRDRAGQGEEEQEEHAGSTLPRIGGFLKKN